MSICLAAALAAMTIAGCQKAKPEGEASSSEAETSEAAESGSQSEPQIETQDTKEADIVVVGAGGAGLSAALEAVAGGAQSVIILEMTDHTGGSLKNYNASISAAGTVLQEEDGIEDDTDTYAEDIYDTGSGFDGTPNREMIEQYALESTDTFQWLWDHGLAEYKFKTDSEGRKSLSDPAHLIYFNPRTYEPLPKDGKSYQSAIHELLDQMVKEQSAIQIEYKTKAVELADSGKGQVLSVIGEHLDKGGATRYNAKKGIIIATGGYSANQKLISHYVPQGEAYLTGGPESADGNGLLLMQKVGGALNEQSMSWIPTLPMGLESEDKPGTGTIAATDTWKAGGISVNQNGERFMNETSGDPADRETALEQQPGAVQYDIFTDKILEDLSAAKQAAMYNQDFRNEKSAGYKTVKEAAGLDELAAAIGVPAGTLKVTVADYNSHVASGEEDSFGRDFSGEVTPYSVAVNKIEGKHFYAVPLRSICVRTLGGITVNEQMQVVDEAGHAIPGLYAAGEVVGGIWGRLSSSGTGAMGAVTFGRMAARQAMTLPLEEGYKVKKASNLLDESLFDGKRVKAATPGEAERAENEVSGPGESAWRDGVYEAGFKAGEGGWVVRVSVNGGKISDITAEEDYDVPDEEKTVLDEMSEAMVEKNSPDVKADGDLPVKFQKAVTTCLKEAAVSGEAENSDDSAMTGPGVVKSKKAR